MNAKMLAPLQYVFLFRLTLSEIFIESNITDTHTQNNSKRGEKKNGDRESDTGHFLKSVYSKDNVNINLLEIEATTPLSLLLK